MPRPKRTKVAPSEPIIRAAKSQVAQIEKQPSETSFKTSSERATTNSDDSEGLVTQNKTGVNRRGVAPQEATMSGALALEDLASGPLKPLRGRKRAALSRIAREGDHAKAIERLRARKEKEQGASAGIDVVPTTQEDQMNRKAPFSETGTAMVIASTDETGHAARGARIPRTMTANGSQRRESSVLASFKKKPREPSLLAMVQAQHQQRAIDSDSDGSLNDIQPEDESTPFMNSKSQHPKPQSTPSARSSIPQHSSSSRKRKRASIEPEIQVPASQPSPSQPSSPPAQPALDTGEHDIRADEEPPEPSLPVIQSTQISSQLGTSTLAPPQSSSPPPEPLPKPKSTHLTDTSRKPQTKPSTRPKAATRIQPSRALSPPRSPQSSTSSHPSPVRKTKQSPLKPLTTASLQNLLPRRRVRAKAKEASAFDIPSSSDVELSSDQDELSSHRAPKIRGKKGVIKPTPLKSGKGRPSATYGRQKAVEVSFSGNDSHSEESAGGNDENGEVEPGKKKGGRAVYGKDGATVKGEMRRLAQKFREVDEWALEIEDVTPHSGSSQMVDAR